MQKVTHLILTLVLTSSLQGGAQAQAHGGKRLRSASPGAISKAERDADLRRLVNASGVVEKELNSLGPVMASMKKQVPQIPDTTWGEITKELKKEFTRDKIIEMYVPIYAEHFNAQEVKALLRFYESEVGRKLVAETPVIETEAYFGGIQWGIKIGERIKELLKAKGFNIPIT
ncbi:MAG TPA: DUF2059 domain-containing protein [Pyrinomonadaceae bacterium]|nr:DUF2059 domain-containing protein [Pyrinomonadaceae bacterium]